MFPKFSRGIEISLTERRTSATLSIFRQRHFKPKRFEHFHCGFSNVRFMIAHERVVPENELASSVAGVCDPRIIRPTLIERRYNSFDVGNELAGDVLNFYVFGVVERIERMKDSFLRPLHHDIQINEPANFRRTCL